MNELDILLEDVIDIMQWIGSSLNKVNVTVLGLAFRRQDVRLYLQGVHWWFFTHEQNMVNEAAAAAGYRVIWGDCQDAIKILLRWEAL